MRQAARLVAALAAVLAVAATAPAAGVAATPWQAYQALDRHLFEAQLGATLGEQAQTRAAAAAAASAAATLTEAMPPPAGSAAPLGVAGQRLQAAAAGAEARELAVASARLRTAALGAAMTAAVDSTSAGNATAAQAWLLVRGFEPVTRYSLPSASASVAVASLLHHTLPARRAATLVRSDLLGTYESLLRVSLGDVDTGLQSGLSGKAAEGAGLAQGYWLILRPSYVLQRGAAAAAVIDAGFARLVSAAVAGHAAAVRVASAAIRDHLLAFRAAPLSAADQARRAGQLTRFLGLVPIEYQRGVADGRVVVPIEIQEAITFRDGAAAAFGDLQSYLARTDAGRTRAVRERLDSLQQLLGDAERGSAVAAPSTIAEQAAQVRDELDALYPPAWKQDNPQADFDVITTLLQKVTAAVAAGDYRRAESSRLEAYATFELGPEQRLRGLAPSLFQRVEGLFWYGSDGHDGLAQLVRRNASPTELAVTSAALDQALKESAEAIGEGASRPTVIVNTALITFREGLEAVLILAALSASMVGARRRFRRPLFAGALLALAASAVTWVVAQTLLRSLTRFGERVEAVVGLVAIGVLLLILNWFYHRVYWQENLQGLHRKKKSILAGAGLSLAAAQVVGLVALGFTSVYREGFETTLFLQALTLETGPFVVLQGVALGLAATLAVGFAVVALERKLPHRKMLIATGVTITWVLIVMVGQTVQVLQKVGWVAVTPVDGLHLPYWSGVWLGFYPTWQGLLAQAAAGTFVIGSYFAAEAVRRRRRARILGAPIGVQQN